MNKPRFRNGERKNSIYIWLFVSYSRNNSNHLIWILFAYCGGKRYLILIGTMPNKCKETWQPIQTAPFYFIRHTSQQIKKERKKVYSPKQDYFLLLISNNVTHESPLSFACLIRQTNHWNHEFVFHSNYIYSNLSFHRLQLRIASWCIWLVILVVRQNEIWSLQFFYH